MTDPITDPLPLPFPGDADSRLAALRRMRLIATGLLVLMAVLFVLTTLYGSGWPPWSYLRAFAEAAMIGACADWFAVVALFRRPFGLPIPHTAIVPRNKERIGRGLGAFLCNNVLVAETVTSRLHALDPASRLAGWIADPGNARRTARWVVRQAPWLLAAINDPALRAFVGGQARRAVDGVLLTPLAVRAWVALKERGYQALLLDAGLDALERFLDGHRDGVRQAVAARSYRWIPAWVDDRMAGMLFDALMQTLAHLHDPSHTWRIEIDSRLDEFLRSAADDPALIAQGEKLKHALLDDPAMQDHFDRMWSEIRARLAGGGEAGPRVAAILASFGQRLADDAALRDTVNRWLVRIVERTAVPNRDAIGAFVAGVVNRWESRTLVEKLELHVGSDLQYIRINGTLVGGLVGLLLFTLTRLLG